ncbi:hypothetical protein [Streptomyces sp. NBC_01589]|uniref:hypothetical protein n=1 Tax=unclassified Streptomyces TaxID=2593676 RepID=UPI00386D9E5B
MLVGTDTERGTDDHATILHAFDTTEGHLTWQLKAPSGREFGSGGSGEIAGGRVYVVRQPLSPGQTPVTGSAPTCSSSTRTPDACCTPCDCRP